MVRVWTRRCRELRREGAKWVGVIPGADAGGQTFHERQVVATRQMGQPISPSGQRNRGNDVRRVPACYRGKAAGLSLERAWAAVGAVGVIDAEDQIAACLRHIERKAVDGGRLRERGVLCQEKIPIAAVGRGKNVCLADRNRASER